MTDGTDLAAAAADFDRSSLTESVAEAERERVLADFPLGEWPQLPLERYALGLDRQPGSGPPFFRLLEFGTPQLGSIKGGSAAKHIMYRHNSGEWRMAAPLQSCGQPRQVGGTGAGDGYRFAPERSEYQHLVPVEWDLSYAQRLDQPQPWKPTFAKVPAQLLREIGAGRSETAAMRTGLAPKPSTAELPDEVRQILDALHRKAR
ncbi:hypothetical protein ACFVUN_01700 [Kitasatospora griseola]|uniref:hypothetical protein n=1 Tax=Kitasatospora griseola TaxID=2064 RepID=UPI0036DC9490